MDKENFADVENEEDESKKLQDDTDRLFSKIQEAKKAFQNKCETLLREETNCQRFLKIIDEKKNELKILEESISLINEKIGETHTHKTFADQLRTLNLNAFETSTFTTLYYAKEVEKDQACINWLKNYSMAENIKILNTEKLKMIKHLGHFFSNTEKLFEIDSLTFNNMQHKIDKIYSKGRIFAESHDDKITKTINIKIHLKIQIKIEEFKRELIDLSSNISNTFNFSVIDYDFMYNVTKRYLLVEIKSLAGRYFELEIQDYLLVDDSFKLWPFDVAVYDIIFALNLKKNDIRPHSKFFHLDPSITESLIFILISKEDYLLYCLRNFEKIVFVNMTENIIQSIKF
jgi:hypothetical protein